jgi:hypothetical protein
MFKKLLILTTLFCLGLSFGASKSVNLYLKLVTVSFCLTCVWSLWLAKWFAYQERLSATNMHINLEKYQLKNSKP